MKSFLYVLAVLLLTLWMVCVLIYTLGAMVHLLLIVALLVIGMLSRVDKKMATRRLHNS